MLLWRSYTPNEILDVLSTFVSTCTCRKLLQYQDFLTLFLSTFLSGLAIDPLDGFQLLHNTLMSGSCINLFDHSRIFMPKQIRNLRGCLAAFFCLCRKGSAKIIRCEPFDPQVFESLFPHTLRMGIAPRSFATKNEPRLLTRCCQNRLWRSRNQDCSGRISGFRRTNARKVIFTYRVDRMANVEQGTKERLGREEFEKIDIPTFSKATFGMFNGEMQRVEMEFHNRMVDTVIDKFGKDVWLSKVDDKHFKVTVSVAVSKQFFAWVFGLGNYAKITGPENVVEEMTKMLEDVGKMYK